MRRAAQRRAVALNQIGCRAPAIQVRVELVKDTGENAVARRIRDAFRTQAKDRFHVETDDGEDVLVKKLRGQPDFGLAIVEQTVTGVRFRLRRE